MTNREDPQNLTWLDNIFLLTVLKHDMKIGEDAFQIVGHKCEWATNSGDNYGSHMYRLHISYKIQNVTSKSPGYKSYIVKCMLSLDNDVGKMQKASRFFEREKNVYCETLELMKGLFKTIGEEFSISPKYIYSTDKPCELIVMEDLKPKGFKIGDRLVGFDLKHCEMIMEKLAMYHASSMILNRKDPQFRKMYNVGAIYEGMPETLSSYFKSNVRQGIEVMKRLPGCFKYVKMTEAFEKRLIPGGIELLKPIPEDCFEFNILKHGDFWLNNIMFKYNESGEPVEVKFVDFQLGHFGNPGQDINYFFITSTTEHTRNYCRNELLSLYHKNLVNYLEKFNYDKAIPTLEDVHEVLKKSKAISLMTAFIALPVIKMNKVTSNEISPESLIDNKVTSGVKNNIFNNNIYEETLVDVLKHLEDIDHMYPLIE